MTTSVLNVELNSRKARREADLFKKSLTDLDDKGAKVARGFGKVQNKLGKGLSQNSSRLKTNSERLSNYAKKTQTSTNKNKKFNESITKSNAGLKKYTSGLSNVKSLLGGTAVFAGLALLGRSIFSYQDSLAEVSTLVDTATFDMEKLNKAALDQSRAFGSPPTEQMKAFYQAISAGAGTADQAIDVVVAANKLAVGGVTDITTATDGLTNVLNSYGDQVKDATDVSDAMFVAMKAGKTTIGELSGSVGKVAPLASQAGVSFNELVGATAAITKGGVSTSIAMNGLRAILAGVVKPTTEAIEESKKLGLEFNVAALKSKGFAKFIEEVKDKTKGSTESIAQLFGGVEALVPVLGLTGSASKDFADILVQMESKAGATQEAFQKMADASPTHQFNRAVKGLMASIIGLGQSTATIAAGGLKLFADNIPLITKSVGFLAIALTGKLVAAFILATRQAFLYQIALGRMAGLSATATIATTGLGAAVVGVGKAFRFMGGWVGIAITGLVSLALWVSNSKTETDKFKNSLELNNGAFNTQEEILNSVIGLSEEYVTATKERGAAVRSEVGDLILNSEALLENEKAILGVMKAKRFAFNAEQAELKKKGARAGRSDGGANDIFAPLSTSNFDNNIIKQKAVIETHLETLAKLKARRKALTDGEGGLTVSITSDRPKELDEEILRLQKRNQQLTLSKTEFYKLSDAYKVLSPLEQKSALNLFKSNLALEKKNKLSKGSNSANDKSAKSIDALNKSFASELASLDRRELAINASDQALLKYDLTQKKFGETLEGYSEKQINEILLRTKNIEKLETQKEKTDELVKANDALKESIQSQQDNVITLDFKAKAIDASLTNDQQEQALAFAEIAAQRMADIKATGNVVLADENALLSRNAFLKNASTTATLSANEEARTLEKTLSDKVLVLEDMRQKLILLPADYERWRNSQDLLNGTTNSTIINLEKQNAALEKAKSKQKEFAQAVVGGKDGITGYFDNMKTKALEALATLALFGKNGSGGILGGLFGGGGGGGVSNFIGSLFGFHEGGIVGSGEHSFVRSMPKMHSGGIVGSNEQATVLQKGEGVFTKSQMKALTPNNNTSGNDVTVNLTLVNPDGTTRKSQSKSKSDGGEIDLQLDLRKMIEGVVSDGLVNRKSDIHAAAEAGGFVNGD